VGNKITVVEAQKIVEMVELDYGNKLASFDRITESELESFFQEVGKLDSANPEKIAELVVRWGRGCIARGVAVERKRLTICVKCHQPLSQPTCRCCITRGAGDASVSEGRGDDDD